MNTYGMLSLKLHWRNLSDSQQTFSSCALETGNRSERPDLPQIAITGYRKDLDVASYPLKAYLFYIRQRISRRHPQFDRSYSVTRRAVFLTKSRKRVTQPDWRMVTSTWSSAAQTRERVNLVQITFL